MHPAQTVQCYILSCYTFTYFLFIFSHSPFSTVKLKQRFQNKRLSRAYYSVCHHIIKILVVQSVIDTHTDTFMTWSYSCNLIVYESSAN